jgi:KAP family P-loop domain
MRKLLLDLPARNPALGVPDAALALARIIDQSDPRFAVGIFGGWGSGKTTLMKTIQGQLNADRVVSVEFSAWRYEREEHLIVPLLDTIREALVEWSAGRQDRALARKTAKTIGRAIASILAGASMEIGLPGAIALSFDANKALTEHGTRFSKDDDAYVPRSFYHASFRALQKAFDTFNNDSAGRGRRIVVFVDDLDRCLPEKALQVLESMKLFFDLPGFVFVVGLDQSVVEYVIDAKYSRPATGTPEPINRITGEEYIKKIFQLPYRLAPVALDQLDEFLRAAYEEGDLSGEQCEELSVRVTPHLRWVVGEAAVNPREIKRFINAYTLLVEVNAGSELDAGALLALQAIDFRRDWRRVQDALLEYQDVFIDALRRATDEPDALRDLDPELESIPEDFLEYIAPTSPGHRLLDVGPLGRYISSGQAVRSTQSLALLEALSAAGTVRRLLGRLRGLEREGFIDTLGRVLPDVRRRLSEAEGSLISAGSGPLHEASLHDLQELRSALEGSADVPVTDPAEASQRLDVLAHRLTRRLLRLYRQGEIGGGVAMAMSSSPEWSPSGTQQEWSERDWNEWQRRGRREPHPPPAL